MRRAHNTKVDARLLGGAVDEAEILLAERELEVRRIVPGLDQPALALDGVPDRRPFENIEQDAAVEVECSPEGERLAQRRHRRAEGQVNHELDRGAGSGTADVPDIPERAEQR